MATAVEKATGLWRAGYLRTGSHLATTARGAGVQVAVLSAIIYFLFFLFFLLTSR
jgi:multisubunit Na+/H+ antiporter MnhG subunit